MTRETENAIIFDAVRPMLDQQGFKGAGRIDAINGACDRFRAAVTGQPVSGPGLSGAGLVSGVVPPTVHLADPAAFFEHMKKTNTLGPVLTQDEIDGCNAIIEACGNADWPIADTAYALATAYHETAGTMKPIREYGRGRGRKYGVPGPHGGQIAYGRGFVQLTWPPNYEKSDTKLGLGGTLIANYERALEPEIAAAIMIGGMREGWFTSRDLDDDLPREGVATLDQFIKSRDIINGTDKAALIAGEAIDFQGGLVAGRWQ